MIRETENESGTQSLAYVSLKFDKGWTNQSYDDRTQGMEKGEDYSETCKLRLLIERV